MERFGIARDPRADVRDSSGSNLHGARARPRDVSVLEEVAGDGPSARFDRSLAVLIGIDTYGEGISPLRSAVADARAIAEALRRDHGFETWCLFDDDAGLPHLLGLLREKLPGALGPNDRLLLYFAGHGIALDGDAGPAGYLVPAHARRADPDGFLPMHVVHGELARLPVRHALVILDCCFAGTFRWSSLRDIEPMATKIYRERYDCYVESPAWQVLTSTSADQLALDMLANGRGEGESTHSPFALALLEALAGGADYTHDHLITADELAMFVRERVAPAAESVGRRQVPQLFPLERHEAGQFVFQVPDRPLALASAPPLGDDANPYRGLRSFRAQDRALFFGRDAVTARLIATVTAQQLTVVVGPSGSGKSSVVQAGLVPALADLGWSVLPAQRPGHRPLAALDTWTNALGATPRPGDPVAAWLAAVAARARAQPDRPWLVIVDQLEELLTHRTGEADRAAFLGALASALGTAPHLHLVVTVRSDAEPQLHDTALAPWWTPGRFTVPAMTRDELRQIIEQPATAAVLHFEPSRLVERLIDDVALVPAPLPLLSFALSEPYRRCWSRWQAGDRDRALRETDYDELGSVARALTQRATMLHDELVAGDAAYATTIRNVFTRMVAVVGGEIARRRVPRDELVYRDPAENRRVDEVLQRFHDARLISLGTDAVEDGGAGAYAEPTHDELVRGWTKVGQWLDELDATAGARALLAALGAAVRAWRASGRADSYLWSDPRVELLPTIGHGRPFAFNADEARFIARSARVRRGRRVRLIGSLLAVIAVLTVAAGIALWQRRLASDEADRANQNAEQNRSLLAQSYQEVGRQLLLDGHPQEAVPYFVAARQKGQEGAPLRMLFWMATRSLPLIPSFEHQGPVNSAAFSPDGTRVVTASSDDTARIWDAATGKPLATLAHRAEVAGAAFSPDATRVVTASSDNAARVWDAVTGKPLVTLQHQGSVNSAAFSPDGARIVTASGDGTARVWDITTGKALVVLPHEKLQSAAFSPDGTLIVTSGNDQIVRIWDAATGKALADLEHQGWVSSAAFSPDGTRVVTASADNTARVWDAITGKPLTAPLEHRAKVFRAAFSPDGTRVVTASGDGTARVWDVTTSMPLTTLEHQAGVFSAAFSPDGTRVVTTSNDKTARVWDVATGRPLATLPHQGSVRSAAFSSDNTRIVTASSDQTARVWDLANRKPLATPLEHHALVKSAAFSPDGTRAVTASFDKTARVWDVATGKPIATLLHQGLVLSAAFSPDSTRVVTASRDQTARVWDATTGKPIATLPHQGLVSSAAFSPDGTRVVTASGDQTARVWEAATGKPLTTPLQHQAEVFSAAFSPDGTRVVTASGDRTARVWDVTTGKPLTSPLPHQAEVHSAAFSPDGTRLVTRGRDQTAYIWDATTGRPLGTLQHDNEVMSVAFSPDGSRVITASADKTARVWDAATGESLATLQHENGVMSAAFSPDGSRVVTGSSDYIARVWDATTGKLLATLESQGIVSSAGFSPDGTRVVTASSDGIARIWETRPDQRTLTEWSALAERSPFVLSGSVHVRRAPPTRGSAQP